MFRAVPYAAPPIGQLRFKPPQPAAAWTGVRDATTHGAIAPQPRSRLAAAMGDFERQQAEDCLTLTIWTPAPDGMRRPVLVWFHGGAFLSGAGSLDMYSGARMAERGDVVVVGVNYRLGALGFMSLPGVSPANLGLMDQHAALAWVSREIAGFGGDPANITIFGQSAGGTSVTSMLAVPQSRALFRRVIIQSAPFGSMQRTAADAAATGAQLQTLLGITTPERWLDVPAADIIAAQVQIMRSSARFANMASPFYAVGDGVMLGQGVVAAALAGAAERDVMIGYTRDEPLAFHAQDEAFKAAGSDLIEARFRDFFGAAAPDAIAEYRQRAKAPNLHDALIAMLGDVSFGGGSLAFAERLAGIGRPAFAYRFDWAAPGNVFGACHCIELPFVFDNLEQWNAPMLAGGDAEAMAALADRVQDAWIGFARTGNPHHAGLPAWPRLDAGQRQIMLLDDAPRIAHDPGGRGTWRYWP